MARLIVNIMQATNIILGFRFFIVILNMGKWGSMIGVGRVDKRL